MTLMNHVRVKSYLPQIRITMFMEIGFGLNSESPYIWTFGHTYVENILATDLHDESSWMHCSIDYRAMHPSIEFRKSIYMDFRSYVCRKHTCHRFA